MALSDHIGDIITAYKAQPGKSERRNRILSHLKDAHAHALLDDMEAGDSVHLKDGSPLPAATRLPGFQPGTCTCKPGMVDQHCPVHGRPL